MSKRNSRNKAGNKKRVRKNADTSEYRVLAKTQELPVTVTQILDSMYSSFAFQVVQRYVLPIAQSILYKKYVTRRLEIGLQKRAFIVFDEKVNESFLQSEFAAWIILQNKHLGNTNPFLPTKLSDDEFLREVLKFYFLHRSDVLAKKIKEKEAESYAKQVLKHLSLPKLLPAINRHHTPPLMRKEAPKEYKTHIIEDVERLEVQNFNGKTHTEKATLVKLGQKKTRLDEFAIDEMSIGFRLEHTNDIVFLKFQYPLLDTEYAKLKKSFVPKGRINLEDVVFLLLTLYSGFGLLYKSQFARGLLDIADPKLKKLQDKSTILIGTPFNVPAGKGYFSLFPEVERHFGSVGSFFEAQPLTGTYSLLPLPSFVFMNYCLDRVEAWLNDAAKEKRPLTILFWYPRLHTTLYVDVDLPRFESNNNTKEELIYESVNKNLLPRLHKVKHKKTVFNYAPKKKLSNNSKNYVYKVFVFEV